MLVLNQAELGIARFAAGFGAGIPDREEETLWIDRLLNEALDESFPASDPISSLKFD